MHFPTSEFRTSRFVEQHSSSLSLDPSAVAAAMNRIRNHVHHWLDRLEELAVASRASEQSTEAERAALQAEIERHQQEWEIQVEALDHDRRLLAEAWERLEHEQIAALSISRTVDETPRSARPVPTSTASNTPTERDDVIDQAILRQFESLRRDVRRTAESRGH